LVSRRGLSSERIACGVLQHLGFKVLETRKKVVVRDAEVAEVDVVALSPEGEKYCVEVKAGKIGVSDVRQAYGNAKLLDYKPLIVCKGYADSAVEAAAQELGVKVVTLAEYYHILDPQELELIVRQAVRDVLDEYGLLPLPSKETLTNEDLSMLEALSTYASFDECAKNLGWDVRKLGSTMRRLRLKKALKPAKDYEGVKVQAQRVLSRLTIEYRLQGIEEALREIQRALKT